MAMQLNISGEPSDEIIEIGLTRKGGVVTLTANTANKMNSQDLMSFTVVALKNGKIKVTPHALCKGPHKTKDCFVVDKNNMVVKPI